jgi:hypothetical protein
MALARWMSSTTRGVVPLVIGLELVASGKFWVMASVKPRSAAFHPAIRLHVVARPQVGRRATQGLGDEAAAEIGREQPGCLHELIGHDHGDGFRGQQAKQNQDLRGASLDRSPAAQQHSDKGPWQRD